MSKYPLAFVFLLLCVGCGPATVPGENVDAIYINARVYTVNENEDWAEAIAVRDGKIVAVGTTESISQYQTDNVMDVQGKMLMPGIHDMHIHPTEGGLTERFECGFASTLTVPEILEVVRVCVSKQQAGEWIRGGQWATALIKSDMPPNRQLLDEITKEHPVFLMDWAVHNALAEFGGLKSTGNNRRNSGSSWWAKLSGMLRVTQRVCCWTTQPTRPKNAYHPTVKNKTLKPLNGQSIGL